MIVEMILVIGAAETIPVAALLDRQHDILVVSAPVREVPTAPKLPELPDLLPKRPDPAVIEKVVRGPVLPPEPNFIETLRMRDRENRRGRHTGRTKRFGRATHVHNRVY